MAEQHSHAGRGDRSATRQPLSPHFLFLNAMARPGLASRSRLTDKTHENSPLYLPVARRYNGLLQTARACPIALCGSLGSSGRPGDSGQKHEEYATGTAGASSEPGGRSTIVLGERRMKRGVLSVRLALLVPLGAIVAWAVPQHPVYQEWRDSHLSLEQLERDVRMDDYRLLYYTGLRLNQRRQYVDALPLLLQAARLRPTEARIRDALAEAQMAQGKTGEAFNQLAQFVGTQPGLAEGHLLLGKFYLAMKSGQRAQEELERAVALDPKRAEAWAALSETYAEFTPDKAAALAAAERAAQLQPDNADALLHLATLLSAQSAPEARNKFARALALSPERADIHSRYAAYLLGTGQTADRTQAEMEARRALALGDTNSLSSLTLGRALTLRGADTEAIGPLTHAAERDAYDVVAPGELTRLYRRLGHPTEAERWQRLRLERQAYLTQRQTLLNAALADSQDRARSLRLACLLGRHGEVEEALRYQGLGQGKASDSPAVLIAVAKDLTKGGYARLAVPLLQRAQQIAPDPALLAAARQALDRAQRLH